MISVCMATHNGERYIEMQLNSILEQIGPSDEVIISDDASTDNTLEIINQISDPRIKIIHHKKKEGIPSFLLASQNFENSLKNSKGDYVFLADQDDVWLPNKVQTCLEELKKSDLILHDCEVVDEKLRIIHDSYFKLISSKSGLIHNLISNSYLGCCMAFRSEILYRALPFPNVPHDIWIGLIAEYYGTVKFVEVNMLKYRRHGANLSSSGEKSGNSLFFKLKYRIHILSYFFKKILTA